MSETLLKRWLSQRCIGYQTQGGQITFGVMEGQAEMMNGEVRTAYTLNNDLFIAYELLFERPRIDLPIPQ